MEKVMRALCLGVWISACGGAGAVPRADGGLDADMVVDAGTDVSAADLGADAAIVPRDQIRFPCDPILPVADPGADAPAEGISYIKASNTQPLEAFGLGANFGHSIAISADGLTLAVGSTRECVDSPGINGDQTCCIRVSVGAVYVFHRTGFSRRWVQEAYIKPPTSRGDAFGFSIALSVSGTTLVVGTSGESTYVYRRGSSAWTEAGRLLSANFDAGDHFGERIAVSEDGNVIAVSAPFEDGAATGINGDGTSDWRTDSGAVYVFRASDSGWAQEAYIKAFNPGAADWFGSSMALSGDGRRLVVGAYGEDSSNAMGSDEAHPQAGAVYVFQRGESWTQTAFLKATDIMGTSNFGGAIALSHDGATLAISGSNRIFVRRAAAGVWTEVATLSPPGVPRFFAQSLAMNPDGNLIVAGFTNDGSGARGIGGDPHDNSAMQSGAAFTFDLRVGGWTPYQYIKATNTGANDYFGSAVALGNSTIAVSATGEASAARGVNGNQTDDSVPGAGAVYVY